MGSKLIMANLVERLREEVAAFGSTRYPFGSTRYPVIMREAAGQLKRLTFELGGKSPNIVFADADLDAAVAGAHLGIHLNQGQCCCAGSRLFVEDSIHDAFVERVVELSRKRRVGYPFHPDTEQGPQVDKAQFDKIQRLIRTGLDEGATVVAGGLGRRLMRRLVARFGKLGWWRGVAGEVKELHRECDAALAVGDGVVELQYHRAATTLESVDHDELPQRPRTVEGIGDEQRDEVLQLSHRARCGESHLAHVVADVETGVVDPGGIADVARG